MPYTADTFPAVLSPPKQSLLIQLGVKEIIYPTDEKAMEAEGAKLRKLIDRSNIPATERQRCELPAH